MTQREQTKYKGDHILSATSLASLPTPLAIALALYARPVVKDGEPLHLLKLWQACDTVELLVKLLVVIRIGEVHAHHKLDDGLLDELRDMIERPTLGLWKNMLVKLSAVDLRGKTMLRELSESAAAIALFFNGPDVGPGHSKKKGKSVFSSFSALRNRLAHGGGLSHVAAQRLHEQWQEEIDVFLQRFLWLREVSLYSSTPDGTLLALRGLVPQQATGLTLAMRPEPDEVVAVRGALCVGVWPLIRYGIPYIPELNMRARDTVVEMYARRSSFESFNYTPIGLDIASWSFSKERETAAFNTLFPPGETGARRVGGRDAVESFRTEINKDAKLLVGRRDELRTILDLIGDPSERPPVLWLSGEAGIGKSILVAKIAKRLIDESESVKARTLFVVPYRFRRGDARCSREFFFMLASRSITGADKIADPTSYDIGALRRALESLPSDKECVFVLDGMDEMDEVDPGFITDVCLKLAEEFAQSRNVTWLFAGRALSSHSSLEERFRGAHARVIFDNGLDPLEDDDIRAILLDQSGSARNSLLRHDRSEEIELFTLALSPDVSSQLDTGQLPDEMRKRFARIDRKLDTEARAYAVRGKRAEVSWIVDDGANQMYHVRRTAPTLLSVYFDKTESSFVESVTTQSNGLPLYVRFVVLDILAGRLRDLDGRQKLPEGLGEYYTELLKRVSVGTLFTLMTAVLCLLAVVDEPLTKEQLVVRMRLFLPKEDDVDNWFERTVLHLSSMLRGGRGEQRGSGYSIYHHSLRQHLERDPEIKSSVDNAREWLVEKACHAVPLENAGPYADYMARHAVSHLLDAGRMAEAVTFLDQLKALKDRHKYFPRGYLAVTTKKVALALHKWMDDWALPSKSDDQRATLVAIAETIVPGALADVIVDTYETGVYTAAVRMLIHFHSEAWWANVDDIKDRFLRPYNIVAKHSVGEALSDEFCSASQPERDELLPRIKAMAVSDNIEEREAAGYALQGIFVDNPDLIDYQLISLWADSETNIERMILGEMLVQIAHESRAKAIKEQTVVARATAIEERTAGTRFWNPIWENNQLDIDTYDALTSHQDVQPDRVASVERIAHDHAATDALLERLLEDPYIKADRRKQGPLAQLLDDYDGLAAGSPLIRRASPAVQAAFESTSEMRRLGKDIVRLLFSHSQWAVAEAGTSILAMMVEADHRHLSLIEELLTEKDGYWRVLYGAVDAAFNVRELDEYALFGRAFRHGVEHANARVRGICFDDFFAWIRLSEPEHRKAIIDEFEPVLRQAMEQASDCWELEYLYLLFRLLDTDDFDVASWLRKNNKLARYFGDLEAQPPFYKLEREAFLKQIDRIRVAEVNELQGSC